MKPTSLEEVKSHFMGGEQRLIEEVEFIRGRVFSIVVFDKKIKTVIFCEIRYVFSCSTVEHSIKISSFHLNCHSVVPVDIFLLCMFDALRLL